MADSTRLHRVEDLLQKTLASALQREVRDPRLSFVNISQITVTKDLSLAKVYVSCLRPEAEMPSILKALERASGFLRHQIALHCKLRRVPQLHFIHDKTLAHGQHISSLIDRALAKQPPTDQ